MGSGESAAPSKRDRAESAVATLTAGLPSTSAGGTRGKGGVWEGNLRSPRGWHTTFPNNDSRVGDVDKDGAVISDYIDESFPDSGHSELLARRVATDPRLQCRDVRLGHQSDLGGCSGNGHSFSE